MVKSYKKIGIDIDNVMTQLQPTLEVIAGYYDKPVPSVEDVKDYNLTSVYNITHEESRAFWEEMEYGLCLFAVPNLELIKAMYERYVDEDTKVYAITNRHNKYYSATSNWLTQHEIPVHDLIMTSGVSKVGVLDLYGIELMIDDKPDLFDEARLAGIDTKMVCVDYPYNAGALCDERLARDGSIIKEMR